MSCIMSTFVLRSPQHKPYVLLPPFHISSRSPSLFATNKFSSHELRWCRNKTRVLLCKRLSGQCRDVYMVVYFHLHWWWWAVVDCAVLYWAVLGCTGLYWDELGCTGLYWSLLGWIGLWWAVVDWTAVYWAVLGGVNSSLSVYSAIFGMVTNERPTEQPGEPSASLLLTSVRRQSFAKITSPLISYLSAA